MPEVRSPGRTHRHRATRRDCVDAALAIIKPNQGDDGPDRVEDSYAQSQRVDDAEPGITDKRHQIGMQLLDELRRVTVSRDR